MNEKDDIILEYLHDTGCAQPPKVIHVNLERRGYEMSRKTVGRRLKRLRNISLVEIVREKGNYHIITDRGRAYLAGELDASDIED